MTEESVNRVLRKLDAILEAADEIHPMDIANHIKDDTLWGWTKALRERVYERVGEIESEVQECEEIVRCRDCGYCCESMAWPGAHECNYINRGVEPDGFCAWGERRAE